MFDSQLWQQIISQFHFVRPLWLLAIIPLATVAYLRWKQESSAAMHLAIPEHLRKALTIGDIGWKKQLPLKLLTVSMFLAIIVCAGPTWTKEPSPFGEDKASLLVILDSSQSMLQKDLAPSRLERSKQKIRDLVTLRQGGKTGLVVFSGSAHIAMPLTKDNSVFAPFLAAIQPDIMPVEGKQAETALALIGDQLGNEQAGTVLLITDGANPGTIAAYEQYFEESSHQLLVLAAGNSNAVSDSPMDLSSLKTLASKTSGRLVEVTIDNQDIQSLDRSIERHMQLNNESAMPWKDMGYFLLFPMAVLMLFWFRKGWLVQWCLVGAVCISALHPSMALAETVSLKAESEPAVVESTLWNKINLGWLNLWLTPDQQGQLYFERFEYLEAAKHYEDPMHKGIAYYYASEYQLAHSAFLQVKSDLGLFNAANALARQREYLAARDIYKMMLEQDLDESLIPLVEGNLLVMQGIIDEVNRFSESQANTPEGPEDSFELGDKPQTGDGAEEQVDSAMMREEKLNANEILGSQELADKWLQRVEADPKYFLRAKFQLQLLSQSQSQNQGVKDTNETNKENEINIVGEQ